MAEIEVRELSKRYGSVLAVDRLSFGVGAGTVTGFLGPNGAGKSTTLRILLGLMRPTAGAAIVGGRPYAQLGQPIRTVGAVLDADSFHPGRTGRNHLRALALAGDVPMGRVDEVLGLVGLGEPGDRRVGTYSLGMRQRLGLAGALLGDPSVLVLDEPANGLDPEGIRWLRQFLRYLADEGRTVLVSSHVLAEVAQIVDDVVIISKGRLVTSAPLAALTERRSEVVHVRSPQAGALASGLRGRGITVEVDGASLTAHGVTSEAVGELAAAEGVVLHELRPDAQSLEEVFFELTGGATGQDPAAQDPVAQDPTRGTRPVESVHR